MKVKVMLAVVLLIMSGVFIIGIIIEFFSNEEIGFSSASGIIGLTILPAPKFIIIDSPENITYPFGVAEYISNNMLIDLNVSSGFSVDTWWYDLEDLRHGRMVLSNIGFVPNSSINGVRWENKLTVFGENSGSGEIRNGSVEFFVLVNDTAPLLGSLPSQILACEGQSGFAFGINASDIDEDPLTFDINPKNPFFLLGNGDPPTYENISWYLTYAESQITAGTFNKGDAGFNGWTDYVQDIIVFDGVLGDVNQTRITVIEINNPLSVQNVSNLTLDLDSLNNTLYLVLNVSDVEDGDASSGNFGYNISFNGNGSLIFNVSEFGVINYTGKSSDVGFYEVDICVSDRALDIVHPSVSTCGVGVELNYTVCIEFNMTIEEDEIVITPPPSGGGGGGGGGGTPTAFCAINIVCDDWFTCLNTVDSIGALEGEETNIIREQCEFFDYNTDDCGFQRRGCYDVNQCKRNTDELPSMLQSCFYTANPSCSDGIKNCHGGGCESLVDCGGPCLTCPTCSDGIRNQGEFDIDCGGPCQTICELNIPASNLGLLSYFLSRNVLIFVAIFIIIILILLALRVRKVLKLKQQTLMKRKNVFARMK